MTNILTYLKTTYHPLAIIAYGSYADGSNNENSDFDALVIADCREKSHDTSVQDGIQLDVFVYPPSAFSGAFDWEEIDQIADGSIVMDTDGCAEKLLQGVREYLLAKPRKTAAEIADELGWCRKMLLRAERQDAEGSFRLHWLLVDSLEIFCDVMGIPYRGPKKSLRWMEKHEPQGYDCYARALKEYSIAASGQWIDWLEAHS